MKQQDHTRNVSGATARFSATTLGSRLCAPIVEAAPLAIVAIGPEVDIQFLNEEGERLFGYIDLFKQVNDRFGHANGDAVLREVANLMRHECRAIDIISRYGGEEFALALPGSDLLAGATLCERIRRAFCAFDWGCIAPGLAVTISAGVSAWSRGSRSRICSPRPTAAYTKPSAPAVTVFVRRLKIDQSLRHTELPISHSRGCRPDT